MKVGGRQKTGGPFLICVLVGIGEERQKMKANPSNLL